MFTSRALSSRSRRIFSVALPVALILVGGVIARCLLFGEIPAPINQDEAFAGYEAYSLLTTGMDSAGYPFPVYLTAWGSGMNALESYLMIPFIALFGLKTWVIRLPQLIVGCFSLWVLYLLMRRLADEKTALCSLLVLSICPWHIMLSRWALESNLAPGFLLFGLYFFVRGLDNSRFFMLSALMYGLSLYCYATIWPFVPFIILLSVIYCGWQGKLKFDRWLLLSGVILGLLALPLLLFMAINFGWMDEIVLPFFSIPRLVYMRASEFSFSDIFSKLRLFLSVMIKQSDGQIWNSPGLYGLLYLISLPFMALGFLCCAKRIILSFRQLRFCPEFLILPQLLSGVVMGITINVNVNRINIIFIPLVILTGIGIRCALDLWHGKLAAPIFILYAICFICFEVYYFTDYPQLSSRHFCQGVDHAVETAASFERPVYVIGNIEHSRILFCSKQDPQEFRDTIKYTNYPSAFLKPSEFGRWHFTDAPPAQPDPDAVYLFDQTEIPESFAADHFVQECYGYYSIAYVP